MFVLSLEILPLQCHSSKRLHECLNGMLLPIDLFIFIFYIFLEYNITFHEDKTTWIDAVKHCYDNDGVLYNNKDDIKNRLTNISIDSEVWAGQYKVLSPWTVTWGKPCRDKIKHLCNAHIQS